MACVENGMGGSYGKLCGGSGILLGQFSVGCLGHSVKPFGVGLAHWP